MVELTDEEYLAGLMSRWSTVSRKHPSPEPMMKMARRDLAELRQRAIKIYCDSLPGIHKEHRDDPYSYFAPMLELREALNGERPDIACMYAYIMLHFGAVDGKYEKRFLVNLINELEGPYDKPWQPVLAEAEYRQRKHGKKVSRLKGG